MILIVKGTLRVGQVALRFAFMLVVMLVVQSQLFIPSLLTYFNLRKTDQVAFIISIVAGLGVGEILFGRYISATSTH